MQLAVDICQSGQETGAFVMSRHKDGDAAARSIIWKHPGPPVGQRYGGEDLKTKYGDGNREQNRDHRQRVGGERLHPIISLLLGRNATQFSSAVAQAVRFERGRHRRRGRTPIYLRATEPVCPPFVSPLKFPANGEIDREFYRFAQWRGVA